MTPVYTRLVALVMNTLLDGQRSRRILYNEWEVCLWKMFSIVQFLNTRQQSQSTHYLKIEKFDYNPSPPVSFIYIWLINKNEKRFPPLIKCSYFIWLLYRWFVFCEISEIMDARHLYTVLMFNIIEYV